MIPYLRRILKVIVLKLFLLICFVDLANLAYKLYEIYKFLSIMNVHKHFINTPLAPPFFYSNRGCFVSLEIYRLSGKLTVIKARRSGAYQKARIGREMRAYKNFILSSHMRRNWEPCIPPTGLGDGPRTGRLLCTPNAGAGSGTALRRNRPIFLPPGGRSALPAGARSVFLSVEDPLPRRPAAPPPRRAGHPPGGAPSGRGTLRAGPSLPPLRPIGDPLGRRSCLHSRAIGLADSACRSGRHTFKKFYFKKTIINNISRQKKHTFAMIKGYKMMILRPLLKFSRFEFLKFCEFWYLPIVPDFTNFNVYFRRNNLRLQFIPYLKIFLNLNLSQKIDHFQQILKLENQYLQFILKKIHGGTFYGETPGLLDRPGGLGPPGGCPVAPQGHPPGGAEGGALQGARCCGERYPSAPAKLDPRLPLGLPTVSFTPFQSSPELGRRPLCADGTEGALRPLLPPFAWLRQKSKAGRAASPRDRAPRVPLDRPSTFGEATQGFQAARPCGSKLSGPSASPGRHPLNRFAMSIGRKRQAFSSSSPLEKCLRAEPTPEGRKARPPEDRWMRRHPSARLAPQAPRPEGAPPGGWHREAMQRGAPASAGCHTRHKAQPPSSGANSVRSKFSLCTLPDGKRLSAHVSPKSFLYDYRKNYFFYFPKIFQYLIIHNFYYLVSKKISFNEISCIFQKLKPQSKSK